MKRQAASPRSEAKAETHERILESAARLMRRHGLAATSVLDVMRGAGLTAGGFYAHFRSKSLMDAEVLKTTLASIHARWLDGAEASGWLAGVVKRYLSAAHRDAPEEGCPIPAVLSEVARAGEETRAVMREAFARAAGAIGEHAPETPGVTPRERALATLALCVGGLAVARALRGTPESDEVLRACRKWALPEERPRRRRVVRSRRPSAP